MKRSRLFGDWRSNRIPFERNIKANLLLNYTRHPKHDRWTIDERQMNALRIIRLAQQHFTNSNGRLRSCCLAWLSDRDLVRTGGIWIFNNSSLGLVGNECRQTRWRWCYRCEENRVKKKPGERMPALIVNHFCGVFCFFGWERRRINRMKMHI